MNKKTFSLFFSLFLFLTAITLVKARPVYQDITNVVASNTQYNPDKWYAFTINWTESNDLAGNPANITNATFEANFVGTATNYTAGVHNDTTGRYWINFTAGINITGAGTFSYKWYATNTTNAKPTNSTPSQAYVIAKNATGSGINQSITVYAYGGTSSTVHNNGATSVQGQGSPYANCYIINSLEGTTNLWRDSTAWTQGSSGATSLSIGSYTVKCNITGNTNYTNNNTGISNTLTVITSGSGGGGGYAIYDGETTTQPTQPFATVGEEWQLPELDQNTIIILVIIGGLILVSRKKK